MKIDTFMVLYRNKKKSEDKAELISARIRDSYVPIDKKREVAKDVVARSSGDSVLRYILSYLSLIDLYTDFEYDKKKTDAAFDKFAELGVFDELSKKVKTREVAEYLKIVELVGEDEG